jgi:hypothetical protein
MNKFAKKYPKKELVKNLYPGDLVKVAISDADYSFENGWINFYQMTYVSQDQDYVQLIDHKNKKCEVHHTRIAELIQNATGKQLNLF